MWPQHGDNLLIQAIGGLEAVLNVALRKMTRVYK